MKKFVEDNYLYLLLLLGILGGTEFPGQYGYLGRDLPITRDSAMGETLGLVQSDLFDQQYPSWMNKTQFLRTPLFPDMHGGMFRSHLNVINTWLVTEGGVVIPEAPSSSSNRGESSGSARRSHRSMAESVFPGSDLCDEDMDLIDILWKQDIDMGVGREVYDPSLRMELERKREQEQQLQQQQHVKQEKHQYPHQPQMGDGNIDPSLTQLPPFQQPQQQQQWIPPSGKIDPETGEFLLSSDFFSNEGKPSSVLMSPPLPQQQQPAQQFIGQQQHQPFLGQQFQLQQQQNIEPITSQALSRAFDEVRGNQLPAPAVNTARVTMPIPADVLPQQARPALLSQLSVEQTLNHMYDFPSSSNNTGLVAPVSQPINNSLFNSNTSMENSSSSAAPQVNLTSALIHNASFAVVNRQPSVVPSLSAQQHAQSSMNGSAWFGDDIGNLNDSSSNVSMGGFLQDLFEDNGGNGSGSASFDPETGEPIVGNNTLAAASQGFENFLNSSTGLNGTSLPANQQSLWNETTAQAVAGSNDLFESNLYGNSPDWLSEGSDLGNINGSSLTSSTSGRESDFNETSDYGGSSSEMMSRRMRHQQPTAAGALFNFDGSMPARHGPQGSGHMMGNSGHVRHNHTYGAPPGGVPHVRKMDMKQEKPSQRGGSRDQRRLMELGIPLTVGQIVSSAVEEFNDLLRSYDFTSSQLQAVRDIRRRGKNKVAAQNCRRRRMGAVLDIGDRVETLAQERESVQNAREEVRRALDAAKGRLEATRHDVFAALRDERGQAYNQREWGLEVGPSGAVVLVRNAVTVGARAGERGVRRGERKQEG